MTQRKSNTRGGTLTVVQWSMFCTFAILRITGDIAWSWWWVTAPLWLPPLALIVTAIVLVVVCWPLATALELVTRKRRMKRLRRILGGGR